MYNRYVPDPNGGYRRMEIHPADCPQPAEIASAAEPAGESCSTRPAKPCAKGGFDTDDLLILLILLLLLLDGEETDRLSILAALAAFILL